MAVVGAIPQIRKIRPIRSPLLMRPSGNARPRGTVEPPYSARIAASGSIPAARRAGIQHATSVTTVSSAATAA